MDDEVNDVNENSEVSRETRFEAVLALTVHDIKNSLVLLLDRLDTCIDNDNAIIEEPSAFKYEIKRINNNLVRLLNLYKMGVNHYSIQRSDYVVMEFLEEVGLEYQAMFKNKGIGFELDVPEDLWCYCDSRLLSGVIDNALNNAARYTKSNIKVSALREGPFVVIRVEDDGCGYPVKMLEQCNLSGNDVSLEQTNGATGLGLYFSAMVAKLHKVDDLTGSISLANGGSLGGSCFTLYIPSS